MPIKLWPKKIEPDSTTRDQFLHVNDIAPTVYEIIGITPPKEVNGYIQDPIDGTSFVYTFNDARAENKKHTQFFDNNGSRGVYHDGWFASTFGPLYPWVSAQKGLANWDSNKDVWQLYDLHDDFFTGNGCVSQVSGKTGGDEGTLFARG